MAPPAHKKRKLSPSSSSDDDDGLVPIIASAAPAEEGGTATEGTNSTPSSRIKRSEGRNHPSPIATGAFNSNVFQLQVDELLSKVRPRDGRMVKAEHALRKLKGIIESIPDREPIPILQAEREQHESHAVRIPFPNPRPEREAKYTLAYSRPANINVVGSYARKTAVHVGDQLGIDLAVTMPSSLFQEKDYLNYRYFHKRAYYLACIATGIEETGNCTFGISFTYQNDNHLQPIIIVSPGHSDDDDFSISKCQIRIILAADEALFPVAKTWPDKNCIRKKAEVASLSDNSTILTPFYNASLRSECSSLAYLKYLHGACLQSDGFADACVLGSIWLRQRGLGASLARGGFGPFEWACMMALLLQGGGPKGKPMLSKGYSSNQLLKAMLQFLSMTDLASKPVFIKADTVDLADRERPVLFDGVRGMNILFKMTPWSYAMLRHEASRTLKLLNDTLSHQFDACFITNLSDSMERFDSVIELPLTRLRTSATPTADALDEGVTFCRQVYQVLKRGLRDRVLLIHIKLPEKPTWSPRSLERRSKATPPIQIGLFLDPEQVNRTVDRGPSAQDKEEAAGFRKFWGEKAELRRFKDGSIQESLIWSQNDPANNVLKQIVTYIIRRHVGYEQASDFKVFASSFEGLLPSLSVASIDPLAIYQPAMTAFEVLEKEIRGLQGLPLQIRHISAADPQLRYASTNVPILKPTQCQMQPANVYVQFEGSNRWPDDIAAVQRTKIAFLLKMGELLEELMTGLTARLALENTTDRLVNTAFLDVIYKTGAFFRLRVHHERELSLLERTLKDKSHTQASREETASALSTYKRSFVQAALHTQAVRILSTRFPLLSPSIRLMKKWRDSHLLSHHISDELIELLTIRTFTHPGPWSIPGSIMTGFLRTLTFISKWDWRSEPLIVDFNGEMSSKDIDGIHLRFEAWRKIDPALNRIAMFAASNIDPDGITWTELGPSKVVAARFTSLARAACRLVKEQGLEIEPERLFAASMADYDFLVHLSPKIVGEMQRGEKSTQPVFKNLQILTHEDKSLIEFDPVRSYLVELRSIYGSNVLFFHNDHGGSVVAGLWNPQTGPRTWKVNLQYNTMPVAPSSDGQGYVSANKNAMLHDIARLGGDMVSRIEVKN